MQRGTRESSMHDVCQHLSPGRAAPSANSLSPTCTGRGGVAGLAEAAAGQVDRMRKFRVQDAQRTQDAAAVVQTLLEAESLEISLAAQLDAEIAAVAEEIAAHEIDLEIAALDATLQGNEPQKGTWADLELRLLRAEERACVAEVSTL